jgi:hypothetical protein
MCNRLSILQIEKLQAAGLIKGGSLDNAMVCRLVYKFVLVLYLMCFCMRWDFYVVPYLIKHT